MRTTSCCEAALISAGVEEAFRAAAQAAALAGFDILISPVGPDSQKNTTSAAQLASTLVVEEVSGI
ncbi:MAG: hypothetical protein SOW59_09465 [Corynebacterium sp.]|nr:hypothetical protein [Corynebacterium sp.]